MKKTTKIAQTFCTGCGMCSEIGCNLQHGKSGFFEAEIKQENDSFYKNICPALNNTELKTEIWGDVHKSYFGWASNPELRRKASSGGTISALAMHLLDSEMVDGVIHCCADSKVPYKTVTVCSRTSEEVFTRCGSRYTESSPLLNISSLIQPGKKYAFIGKPCDVYSLRKFSLSDNTWSSQIIYYLSFFCAGTPSIRANEKLIKSLIGDKKCRSLNYRGNGWPGETIVEDENGQSKGMSYENSWGGILGRDVRKICRMCNDGIGLYADVACYDAWYLNSSNQPDFNEKEGRNGIFIRSTQGLNLVESAMNAGYISCEQFDDYDQYLRKIQNYQFTRRATMKDKILALKLCGKEVPLYSTQGINRQAECIDSKSRKRIFLGMIKRIIKGKFN